MCFLSEAAFMKPALIPCTFSSTTSGDLHNHELNTGFGGVGKGADADEEREFISGRGPRVGARYNSSIALRSATDINT